MSLHNRFILPLVISCLAALIGCGSNALPKPNQGGFTNKNLSGTYVFSTQGQDGNGNFLSIAGAFTTDGTGGGGISGGTMDVVDSGITLASPVAQPITTGTYSVASDGRGQVTLTSSVGTFRFKFVLAAGGATSSHGVISEFDSNGTGSGTLDLQTAPANQAQLAGSYAFNLGGIDSSFDTFASVGAFAIDSTGAFTGGIEDSNAGGAIFAAETATGSAIIGSGTTPGTLTLTTSSFPLTYDFYPIDATHWKVIETDFNDILSGDVFTQTGASVPSGTMVFTMAGGISSPIVAGGVMTSSGNGNFPTGLEDVNNNGAISPGQVPFSGTPAAAAGFGGRQVINLSGFDPAIQWVIYPTTNGGLIMMEIDALNVMQGTGFLQTATAFSAGTSVGYGFNLTAVNPGSLVDDIAQFNANTTTTNNITGILDENDQGSLDPSVTLTGTYTADSPVTGRGNILVPSLSTPLGGLSLEYYVINDGSVIFIETDTQQIGLGVFQLQSSGPSAMMARAHFVPASMKSMARSTSKLRRSK